MMDELQSPSSNKKRNIAATDSLPGPKRRLTKKMKIITGDAALSHSSSKTPSNNPPVIPSNRTPRIPPVKNSKAGPSTKSSATSQSRDTITPTRMSSRISRPTLKKKAQFERRSRSPESDGTPPSSIIPPAPPLSLKRKKPTSSPIKRFGNNIPSKCKRIDPNPIELTSDDDAQPPKKRVKRTQKKPSSYEVIDLCSENEDITPSPKPTRTRDEEPAVLILSTDDDMDIELLSFNHPAFGENTRKSPSLPPLGNISPPAQDEPLLRTLPSPRTHNTPVPKPMTLAAEEDVTTDENIYAENLPRGSLQALYNDALARVSREGRHADIVDQPSPFLSLNCTPPARVIRHSTQSRPPTLHTPLFFDRMILRLKARLKPKTLDAKAFSDTTEQDSMALNNVMESSDVDNVAPEVVTKITLVAPIDFQGDTYTQAAHVSPCILVHDLDITERAVFKAPDSPLPLVNQESPLPSETVILEDTPMSESIQIQEVPINHKAATPESANSPLISLNMSSNAPSSPSNPDADNYKIETPQEDQVATIEPSVLKDAQLLVQTLRRRYGSKTSGSLLLPALESNNKVVPQSLSESSVRSMEHATTTNASFPANSSSKDTSLTSRCLSESPMIRTDNTTILDVPPNITSRPENILSASKFSATPTIILTEQVMTLNSLASSGGQNASPSSECLSDSPAIATQHATAPNPSSLSASSNNADTLSSHNSSPSAPSRQVSDSSASIESVNCHLVTPDNSPSPLTPPIKTQKQEPAIRLDRNSSLPNLVSFFDMDLSKLNLRTLMGNSKFDEGGEDSDDDDISISGMELLYPEEII